MCLRGRDGEEIDGGENDSSNIFVIAGVHWLWGNTS